MKHWKWADCTYFSTSGCCTFSIGERSEQGPCGAEQHNEWVAARWYRRWFADLRAWFNGRDKK